MNDSVTRIETRGVVKQFGGLRHPKVLAVDRVSFQIHEGEFVALIGPSGCGKSTLLNIIAGLIPFNEGEVFIDKNNIRYGDLLPKNVGYVFQKDTVFPWRTVRKNIGYGLELTGKDKALIDKAVQEVIQKSGLEGFEDAYPLMLSGGMRQRVALMRTLILKPEILLMDEPFGALDTHTKLIMHRLLLEIWEKEKQTVLFVTHDLGEALTLSDRIIVLSARPGALKEVFEVDFPRPRDAVSLRETQEYSKLFSEIWHCLGEEFRKSSSFALN